jgi:predicted DCC family thiol-disulfide oxidoreductase YuxK
MIAKVQNSKVLFARLQEMFGLDLRSLALFRIGLALVVLTDLLIRAGDITAFYSDSGILPRTELFKLMNPWHWSLNLINGQPLLQTFIFAAAGLIALLMLVGYRTQFATIATWALITSIHNRNPALLFAADDVLRAILFWAMFLPLGAYYSIDRALNTSSDRLPHRILSGATLALSFQLCYIYIFSAAFKSTSPNWTTEGSAVYYALSYDQYVTPIGQLLLNFPWLMKLSTHITFVLEWIGPLFIFIPFRNHFFRFWTVVTFILLHLGFGLTLNLGIFPFLSIACWLGFLPSDFWNKLAKRTDSPERAGLQINYDADCGFCKKVVHLLRTFLLLPSDTPLLKAQDDPSIHADMQKYNSWVVVDWQGNRHFKWEAIAYIVSLSPVFHPFASLLRLQPVMAVGNRFYETIATNRRAAGMFTRPFKFKELQVRPSRSLNIVTLLLFAFVTLWNFRSLMPKTFDRKTLNSIDWVSRVLNVDQKWSIFSPGPPKDDGWFVIPAKLADGSEVDLLRDAPITWDKPSLQTRNAIYRNMQWRTMFINFNRAEGRVLYPNYGRYLCQSWNDRQPRSKQLTSFEIYFMSERTVPPGEKQGVEKMRKWQQSCEKLD